MNAVPPIEFSGPRVWLAAREAIGGAPKARVHRDADDRHSVDIAEFPDRPLPGHTTWSTLSLHQAPNVLEGVDIRVEIAGVARTADEEVGNLVATAASLVMRDAWACAPGVVFPRLIRRYHPDLSRTMEHVVFTEPFPWPQLSTVRLGDGLAVHWLLAVPISEPERLFLLDNGYDDFEALMESNDADYFDFDRPSVV